MEIIRLPLSGAIPAGGTVLALGFFDGMHRGHRALLDRTVGLAAARGLTPAAFTFSDAGIKPGVPRLQTEGERLSLLGEAGAARVYLADFAALRDMEPGEFCDRVLCGACGAAAVVTGEDFRFGRGAAAGNAALTSLLATHGVPHFVLPTVFEGGEAISASAVRRAVEAGDVARAARLLGRPYTLTGPVLHGQALGRRLGLPTANQGFPPGTVHPAHGVYAVTATLPDGRGLRGLANVGVRPTAGGGAPNCETHFLDYTGDLYGLTVTTRFHARVRAEKKFEDMTALARQIRCDIARAEEMKLWENGQS